MQTKLKIFDDMAKLAIGSFGVVRDLKKEYTQKFKNTAENFTSESSSLNREEIEVLMAMMTEVRVHQEKIEKRLDEVEAKINAHLKTYQSQTKAKT